MKYIIVLLLKLFAISGLCAIFQGNVLGEELRPDLIVIVDDNDLDSENINVRLQSNRIRFDMIQRIGEEEWDQIVDGFEAKELNAEEMAKLQDLEPLILRRGIVVEVFSEGMFYVYYDEYLKPFQKIVTRALRAEIEKKFDKESGESGLYFYKRL